MKNQAVVDIEDYFKLRQQVESNKHLHTEVAELKKQLAIAHRALIITTMPVEMGIGVLESYNKGRPFMTNMDGNTLKVSLNRKYLDRNNQINKVEIDSHNEY
jgi:hypothetical protein